MEGAVAVDFWTGGWFGWEAAPHPSDLRESCDPPTPDQKLHSPLDGWTASTHPHHPCAIFPVAPDSLHVCVTSLVKI